jgi:hypothetical protein
LAELLCKAEEFNLYALPPVSSDAEPDQLLVTVPMDSDTPDVCKSMQVLRRDPDLASWVYVSTTYVYNDVFGNTTLAEGWLDLCALTLPTCTAGELANPAISAYIENWLADEEIGEWRRLATLSAAQQVQMAICNSFNEPSVYQAPPLAFDYKGVSPEDEIVIARLAKPVGELVVIDQNFCGIVTILGRVPEALAPDGKTLIILPWLLLRLGTPLNIEGWVNIDDACIGDKLDICHLSSAMQAGKENARRLTDELRSVPVVESESSPGLPDLVFSFDAPRAGEKCRGLYIVLQNHGASVTPANIQIAYGNEVHELNLLRGLEPGEEVVLNGRDYEQDVLVDPADHIPEADETNNLKRSPEDPKLTCIPVSVP